MRHSPAEHDALAHAFNRDGQVVLRRHFDAALLRAWRCAFEPLLAANVALEQDNPNRGPQRFYVTLPSPACSPTPASTRTPTCSPSSSVSQAPIR